MDQIPVEETEDSGNAIATNPPVPNALKEKMDFLQGARRQLSAEELSSPIVSRFLIEEIERLDTEVRDLRGFRDRFHERDKEVSLLTNQQEHLQSMNLRDAAVLGVGAAGLGGAPSYIAISNFGWVFFGLSLILVGLTFVKRTKS
jgi:phosphate starvation-inducible protein PhoH